jgi:hypothetical protein
VRRKTHQRWLALRSIGGVAALACGLLSSGRTFAQDAERGKRLFHGELPLSGKIVGHANALPPQASRCANCHLPAPSAAQGTNTTSSNASAASYGPVLNAASLTREARRRGGPPSRYDEAAFCKLLTTGIDPAYIVTPSTMPRYALDASDCRALWLHLTAQ